MFEHWELISTFGLALDAFGALIIVMPDLPYITAWIKPQVQRDIENAMDELLPDGNINDSHPGFGEVIEALRSYDRDPRNPEIIGNIGQPTRLFAHNISHSQSAGQIRKGDPNGNNEIVTHFDRIQEAVNNRTIRIRRENRGELFWVGGSLLLIGFIFQFIAKLRYLRFAQLLAIGILATVVGHGLYVVIRGNQ